MRGHVLEIYNLFKKDSEYSRRGKITTYILIGISSGCYIFSLKWRWLLLLGIALYIAIAVYNVLVVNKLASQHKEVLRSNIVTYLKQHSLYNMTSLQILCSVFRTEGNKQRKDFLNILSTLVAPIYGGFVSFLIDTEEFGGIVFLFMVGIIVYAIYAMIKDIYLLASNYRAKISALLAEFLEQELLLSISQERNVS